MGLIGKKVACIVGVLPHLGVSPSIELGKYESATSVMTTRLKHLY